VSQFDDLSTGDFLTDHIVIVGAVGRPSAGHMKRVILS